jgi:glutamate 5-kinase
MNRFVVKIGTSSLTNEAGGVNSQAIVKLVDEVVAVAASGQQAVIVTSGAVTAGLPHLGFEGRRPTELVTLQAAASVGQGALLGAYNEALARHGRVGGQVLLSPRDFFDRRQYLSARQTIEHMLDLGVVPIINENDVVATDELRWGDNDRLAGLVAHAIGATTLVLLTDTPGVFTDDPRINANASLVDEIAELDQLANVTVGGSGTTRGSGGMQSKLLAARMASRMGATAVIAGASRPNVVADALGGIKGTGTVVSPRSSKLSARKLWIAFAAFPQAVVSVDDGAKAALVSGGKSLLRPGVVETSAAFARGDGVELTDASGEVFAKGLTACTSNEFTSGEASLVVHRDDLAILI